MPISEAAPRNKMHHRSIILQGYEREDGLFDVDCELIDTKTYDFEIGGDPRPVGTALHHMRARITANLDFEIVAAEAETVMGPFGLCKGGADSFGRLVGLVIKPGFIKAANERLGGILGCTHIREFLQQMATVVFQTTYPARMRRDAENAHLGPRKNPLLNTCIAHDSAGEVVKQRFPELYTGN